MVWKPKEKPLSREEAITLARDQNQKYWRNATTPFVAQELPKEGGGVSSEAALFALDTEILKKKIVFGFIDPMTYTALSVMNYFDSIKQQYAAFGVLPILVLEQRYAESFKDRFFTEYLDLLGRAHAHPIVFDHDGSISKALAVGAPYHFGALVFYSEGKVLFSGPAGTSFEKLEIELQSYLRKTDRGLPLKKILPDTHFGPVDRYVVPFSGPVGARDKQVSVHFVNATEWNLSNEGARAKLSGAKFEFQVIPEKDCQVGFAIRAREFVSTDRLTLSLSLNGGGIIEEWFGPDLSFDEQGLPALVINQNKHRAYFYRALAHLPVGVPLNVEASVLVSRPELLEQVTFLGVVMGGVSSSQK